MSQPLDAQVEAVEVAVCNVLRDLRRRRRITQLELACALGKPQSFVSKYEARERRLTVGDVFTISEHLQADPLEVLAEVARERSGGRRGND